MSKVIFKCIAPVLLVLMCLVIAVLAVQDYNHASADESSSSTPVQVSVGLKATGYTDGTTTSLEKKVYFAGDTINLNWKGAESGTDLIIPISVTYDDTQMDIGALNKIESLQTENIQYKERMGQNGTMTEYETLRDYVLSDHTVTLGAAVDGLNIYINYARVSPVYRLYNIVTSEHLFSLDKAEYDRLVELCKTRQDVWIGEGIDWLAPTTTDNTKVVHRLYNEGLGSMGHSSHYYTSDEAEIARLIQDHGWVDDGESVQYRTGGPTPIFTCYNEALNSAHHYTSTKNEWEGLEQHGWALERDKNGETGVFQCLVGTSWTFEENYYKVEHYKENLDGTYTLAETQYMKGSAGEPTQAVANSYAGFNVSEFYQQTILNDDTTVVRIDYARQTYNLVLDGNGQAQTTTAGTFKYGEKISEQASVSANGCNFTGWYLDSNCTEIADFESLTMPSGGLTLFAGWNKIEAADGKYIVIFNKNDDNATGIMENMERTIGDNLQLTGNGFSKVVDGVVYGMKYWTTNPDGTGLQYRDKYLGDLDLTQGLPITLYAQWTTVDINPYWIASSSKITTGNTQETANQTNIYYSNPETSIIRLPEEIKHDMQILRDTEHATYNLSEYNEVKAFYESLLATDEYHLYTKWNGATEDMQGESSENSYIEFRILEVGEHAGDRSAMTFQTVHVLPYAYRMNTTRTTTGSWKDSELRKVLSTKEAGSTLESVYDQMPVGFTGDIISVTKQTSAGAGSSDIIETDDRLWIPSYTEYTGEGDVYTYTEGSIYAFWKNMNISTTDNNYSVELYTRAGNIPLSSTHNAPMWGTRSPLKNNAAGWAYNYQGRTSSVPWWAECPIGISFAFCF